MVHHPETLPGILKREMTFSFGLSLAVGSLALVEIELCTFREWGLWLSIIMAFGMITGLIGFLKHYLLNRI